VGRCQQYHIKTTWKDKALCQVLPLLKSVILEVRLQENGKEVKKMIVRNMTNFSVCDVYMLYYDFRRMYVVCNHTNFLCKFITVLIILT